MYTAFWEQYTIYNIPSPESGTHGGFRLPSCHSEPGLSNAKLCYFYHCLLCPFAECRWWIRRLFVPPHSARLLHLFSLSLSLVRSLHLSYNVLMMCHNKSLFHVIYFFALLNWSLEEYNSLSSHWPGVLFPWIGAAAKKNVCALRGCTAHAELQRLRLISGQSFSFLSPWVSL